MTEAPSTSIYNGVIKARLFLPDSKNGYYRASRFDWSGIVSELEYKGHSYFGPWFAQHDPLHHDAITGPVDDFYPVDFDAAQPGESFLKIGIGVLQKPDAKNYSIVTPYKILNSENGR